MKKTLMRPCQVLLKEILWARSEDLELEVDRNGIEVCVSEAVAEVINAHESRRPAADQGDE
jgi:hypothetical protein